MKLSTGKVAFPIEFDNGDKAVIYFNPNDKGIQERINGFEASVEKRIKEIDFEKYKSKFDDNITVTVDLDNPETLLEMSPEELKALQNRLDVANDIEAEYNQAVKSEIDSIFDSNISNVVFKYCQPFDTVIVPDESGTEKRELYIMHFIKWLMVELKNYGVENKTAMDKHLAKYSK